MAKCKRCKTNIPDGTEYCKDCLDKEKAKVNESYLDSLLNSVKNSAPTTESIYKKKNDLNPGNVEMMPDPSPEADFQDEDMFKFDIGDIEDFDQFNMEEDLSDLKGDEIISDKDLFGVDLTEILTDEKTLIRSQTDNTIQPESEEKPAELNKAQLDASSAEREDTLKNDNSNAKHNEDEEIPADNINSNEINNYNDEDGLDADLNELLNQLDDGQNVGEKAYNKEEIPDIKNKETVNNNSSPQKDNSLADNSDDLSSEDEDDFLSLLNQISSDDPVADDVKAINDLMKGVPASRSKGTNMPSDVGEVFSDALKAVSNLNDPNLDEAELLSKIPDKNSKKNKKEKKKKVKDSKGKGSAKKQADMEAGEQPKTGLFQHLFGNVEEKSASKKGDTAKKPSNDTGKEAVEVPKGKGAKSKKGKKGKVSEEEEQGKAKAADNEETENKKEKKKVKKEKKKKSTDVIQVIDEIEEDVGRINRLGATIVFVFFALLALLIYVGSNAVTYTLSIQHATSYFNKQKYTQAYEEVYGMRIEDEDVEIYSKIMTVMFVNKQLNSYNNYCAIHKYPQALDSLLKGLKRYDKYMELATMLGIKRDMDYVRGQILAELKNQFGLSEKDALSFNNIDDTKEYSMKIYDVALENK